MIALQNFCKISNFLQNLVLIPQHSPFPTVPLSLKNPQHYQRSEFAAAHSRKVDFATAHSRPQNLYSTIVHSRPFRYPSKIRNVIKGRNLLRLTAARSEFAAAHSRKVGICRGSQPQGRFCYGSQPPDNLHSTIAKPRPFRYPSKIRNVIKGRNLRRLTAARSEFAAAHSRLTICIAPSLNPDRSAIPQKSATFSNCKSAAHFRPPSTQLKPIFTFLKGEFEAAHSRKVGIYCSFQLQLFG